MIRASGSVVAIKDVNRSFFAGLGVEEQHFSLGQRYQTLPHQYLDSRVIKRLPGVVRFFIKMHK